MNDSKPMGISGRIAALFQSAPITPLLAVMALLLGGFAVLVTPREEEPQIDVTMANVLVAFPGASVRDVEQMVATPGEQVLSKMAGVEHVMSVSRPGMAVLTVQFKVGVPNNEALVRLHDTLRSNSDWLPKGLGVMEPLIKPKGIDDVPIVTLTLHGSSPDTGAYELERVAHSIEADIKRVPGTRDVQTRAAPAGRCWCKWTRSAWPAAASASTTCALPCNQPTWVCRWATCWVVTKAWPSKPGRTCRRRLKWPTWWSRWCRASRCS